MAVFYINDIPQAPCYDTALSVGINKTALFRQHSPALANWLNAPLSPTNCLPLEDNDLPGSHASDNINLAVPTKWRRRLRRLLAVPIESTGAAIECFPLRTQEIQQTITLQFPDDEAYVALTAAIQGADGQVPDLDLFTMMYRRAKRPITLIPRTSPFIDDVLPPHAPGYHQVTGAADWALATLQEPALKLLSLGIGTDATAPSSAYLLHFHRLRGLLHDAVGLALGPSGPHAAFLQRGIDALTLEAVPASAVSSGGEYAARYDMDTTPLTWCALPLQERKLSPLWRLVISLTTF